MNSGNNIAVFGGGCFWCMEAVFLQLKGVEKVVSGYAGGHRENPSYEDVCAGKTGHAEAVKIEYDPKIISYKQLLDVFFHTHDPTSLNRQGNDIGEQYRSIIMYSSEEQKTEARDFMKKLADEKEFSNPIMTELKPLDKFYKAEDYHQSYYAKNPNQPYCQLVITPKMDKFYRRYQALLK